MPVTHKPLIDIRPDHWAIVHDILQKHVPQFEVWSFGSRAKWSAKEYSDLDLAVISDRPLSISTSAALADDFAESDLPWKVDVVDWATTAESFRKIIARDKVVVQKGAGVSEWRQATLGEFVSLQRGHDLTEAEQKPGIVPVMGSAGQNGYHNTALAKGPGIVIGRSGASFGQVHYCSVDYWPHNTTLYVTDFHGNDPRFSFYFLKNINFARYNSGSAQPSLNRNFIYPIEVIIPSVEEQRNIAHILGTLDDKIELNRRMNETLEAIARAMFKSWFVDFDPVRAKMSDELPESICQRLGLTPDHLALFPDRLVDSELGEIPEGWNVKPLDGIADYLNGLALQKFPPESETEWLPVIKIAQLKKGDANGADRASYNLKPEYIVNDGDVIFSWSGSLEVDIWCGGRGALNQHLFKVTSANYPKWFYLYWTKHHLANFQAIAAGKAVTMGHIQRKHLTQALCAVPRKPLMDKLDVIMASLLDKQIENRKASRTLSIVRDELLPKLLSGELHVSEADSNIEVCA